MPNHMKFCSCRHCRAGMHRAGPGKDQVVRAIRRQRYVVKAHIRKNPYGDPPGATSAGYTD